MSSPRPNILIIMVDQLAGTLFPDGPAAFLKTPNLKRLAERSVRFKNCYAASPLCAPARASFMAGQLPSRTRVYDNAAEFASDIPTYAHHLRRAGYQTALSGKMHFVGPDQMHGFEERLTTDIYPADFGWTPDYSKPNERIDWWYHNLGSVTGAGMAEITNQLEYDDEVAFHATQKLFDFARVADARPWCLTVSFTHPHDPYVARRRFFDLYEDAAALNPTVAPIPFEAMDPHSQRLCIASDFRNFSIKDQDVRRSRQAYFGNVSYIDEKVGELLDVLARCQMDERTIVIFLSDHGDMLGERGLWFKMNFFEGSCRVPLLLCAPSLRPALVDAPVSAMDVLPTIADLAGLNMQSVEPWTDGVSLLRTLREGQRPSPVLMEYAAEGSVAPILAIREGNWKYIACTADPPLLFNLADDPGEEVNLAALPEFAAVATRFAADVARNWKVADFDAAVRSSQARRHLVYEALRNGAYYPWDHQPLQKASERYMRNHMDLNVLEDSKRFPRGD
jgi:choline-sulfatase